MADWPKFAKHMATDLAQSPLSSAYSDKSALDIGIKKLTSLLYTCIKAIIPLVHPSPHSK